MKQLFKGILAALLIAAAIGLTGCLISEREMYHLILNDDGKSGMLIFTKYNIQSDANDTAGQDKDFQDMINNWKSDQYLLDQVNHGAYVKERDMRIEHGRIVWTERSIFSDVTKLFPDFTPGDTVRFGYDPDDMDITETNGKLVQVSDSMMVVWPPDTRDFKLTTTTKNFTPKSNLEERFEQYLADQKK